MGTLVMSNLTVGMIGTLDTKGPEFAYLEGELRRYGLSPLMIDISCRADVPEVEPAFRCTEVARRAGWAFGDVARLDKRAAGQIMVGGAKRILEGLYANGAVDGLIALGGANGTLMACEIMQAFPIG
ncbi:MAG: Tm-1-like ATP-binding domain-containing protein, partial [Anaerolineae bacterium]